MRRIVLITITIGAAMAMSSTAVPRDLGDTLAPSADHPAIGYFNYLGHPTRDAVSELNRKIEQGGVQLRFESGNGYLRSVLEWLHVPIESQMAVFSKTSLQAPLIEPKNPRTIFFNDSVSVAWMRGGFMELASQDPEQGVVFYTLQQRPASKPHFERADRCTVCHISDASLGIPGMMVRSRYTAPDGTMRLILGGFTTDQRSPFDDRWGGWYVTGNLGGIRHMGNTVFVTEDRAETIPATIGDGYLSPYSDVAALLVFNHQMHMSNLLTRMGWEARAGAYDKRRDLARILHDAAREFVDYLLFVDETPLPNKVSGTSGFAERFATLGPFDSRGRSLRQLDLDKRLMRYPCSYMIYAEAFDRLPAEAKAAIYKRMWQVL
ncbi:MAG: hypothetical protein JOZ22_07790, partial [Acidobacteriia bacterium]|nr:hypothetical protein [Terriglobia bacterium]